MVFVSVLLHVSVIKANGAAAISEYIRSRFDKSGNRVKPGSCCSKVLDELNREYALNVNTTFVNNKYKTSRTKPGYDFYAQMIVWQLCLFVYVFFFLNKITNIKERHSNINNSVIFNTVEFQYHDQ